MIIHKKYKIQLIKEKWILKNELTLKYKNNIFHRKTPMIIGNKVMA